MSAQRTVESVLRMLAEHGSAKNVSGKARFAIIYPSGTVYGVSAPDMRQIAKSIGTDHELAVALWEAKVLEARHVAYMISDPAKLSDPLVNKWVSEIESWDLADGFMFQLSRVLKPFEKAKELAVRDEEFVKRCGFALMASLAVHHKEKENDARLREFFPFIINASEDDRNFVKKAVNWALRSIGKRNRVLNVEAIKAAEIIAKKPSTAAKWISSDALRELRSNAVQSRLKKVK
eukprot:ANDGO_05926.mRNA.1 hypothetical protein